MRFFATLALALPALAMATAVSRDAETSTPAKCSTGGVYCCNKTTTANDKSIQGLLGALGINVHDIKDLVGLSCSPITVIGVGGNGCKAQTVCCEKTYQNGLVNIGCTAIAL
ncbi:fungal hydrophobin-domain-containing protein [Schizophyllum fasciatum]